MSSHSVEDATQYIKLGGWRIASDSNEYIVAMWDAMSNHGWIPPTIVSEEAYNQIKSNPEKYPKELVGFVGVKLSFGGKWFGGYARDKRSTNFAIEGRKNILNESSLLKGTTFIHSDYKSLIVPENSIIYCDPPYQGTSKYKEKSFDHTAFWQWCRDKASEGHSVFISEYKAPEDFECVWEQEIRTNMDAKQVVKVSVERLFKYKKR